MTHDQTGPLTLYARGCLTPAPAELDLAAYSAVARERAKGLAAFWLAHAEWSRATFGCDTKKGPLGALKHLEKEVGEARAALQRAARCKELATGDEVKNPVARKYYADTTEATQAEALTELADCVFLVFDAARRAGFDYAQLVQACWDKLEVNKQRAWPAPTYSDEPVEHDRSKESR